MYLTAAGTDTEKSGNSFDSKIKFVETLLGFLCLAESRLK